jgi:hypothetical protein
MVERDREGLLELIEDMRKLLQRWESRERTLVEAGITALPVDLHNQTVGMLDATSC